MEHIDNTQETFVALWRLLRRTRRYCHLHCKRFCIRRVLQLWFGGEATPEFIWQVCHLCCQAGWDQLPPPGLYPRPHRELLRALDTAYTIAYPKSTPLNVNKKKKS